MFQYYYCNSALIIYICTIYLFYIKRRIKDMQSRFFEIMLWTGLFSCCFDILSEEAIRHVDQYSLWLFYLIMYLYYILLNSLPFLSSLYELELIDRRKGLKLREKIILYAPVIIAGLLLFSNNWTGLIFYIDDQGVFRHGIGFAYLYIQSGLYLILNIVYLTYYKKVIDRIMRIRVTIISVVIMFLVILDFYMEQVMIQSFCISVCLLLIYISTQNAEDVLEDFTGLLTRNALTRHVQMDFINRNPFTIILIKLEDRTIINFTLGTNHWFSLISEISAYLKSLDGLQEVYNVEDGLFAIKLKHKLPNRKKDQLLRSIMSKFVLSKWSVLNRDLSVSVRMLEISYPKDVEEINNLFYYIKYFHENVINSKNMLIKPKDLNIDEKNQQEEKKKAIIDILESLQYEISFMPVFSVSDNKIVAREALLKLPTDPPTYVSPCDIDHETEDDRKLRKIHRNIFKDICIQLKNNPDHTQNHEFISINVAATQLMQEGLLEQYSAIIRENNLDYRILGIEISEAMYYYEQPIVARNLEDIGKYGIPIIWGQFGIGHCNLGHFKHIPFRYIKMDKGFVQKSLNNKKGISILKSMIAMMNSLHITIIADGVETKEIADRLISLGIDHLQGPYYLSL